MKEYIQEAPKHECGEYFKYVENYIKRINSKNSIDFGPIYYCKKCRVYCIESKEFKSKKQLNESTDNNSTLEKKLRKIMIT